MIKETKSNGLYFITFTYYDDYKDKTVTTQCLVLAPSHSEAIESVTKDFRWIDEITIKEWVSPRLFDTGVNCIYLPDNPNIISAIAEANEY